MGRKELPSQGVNVDKMASILARFYGGSIEAAVAAVIKLKQDNPDITSAEAFRKLSEEKGIGKPHNSSIWGTPWEGKVKSVKAKVRKTTGKFKWRG